jgi:Kef-type K+ transport system membrane component KefB
VGLILGGVLIGPGGVGLLDREGLIAGLGTAGLLYLVFTAGLELDLEGFRRRRRSGLLFGTISFVVPGIVAFVVARWLDFSVVASLLWVAAWGSHTLLTYPLFRRFGVADTKAAAIGVPATLVTDTAAILLLGGAAAYATLGRLNGVFWIRLLGGVAVLGLVTLMAIPSLGRRLFLRTAHDRVERYLFLVAALFVSAVVAEVVDLAAILGAFLAGLGLNRLVPANSALLARVDALGSGLFVPAFLISVGMLIEPGEIFRAPNSLRWGLAFSVVAIGGKWLAAQLFGLTTRMNANDRQALFALTGSQAAATLATAVVGIEIGVIPEEAVNAVVIVVLMSCSIAALVAERTVPRLPDPSEHHQPLGRTVLVPVAHLANASALMKLAAAIASKDGGLVVPINVVLPGRDRPDGLEKLSSNLEETASRAGVEAQAVIRVDTSPEEGILHAVAERDATCLVVGWSGNAVSRFRAVGSTVGTILDRATLPTVIGRFIVEQPLRVVLVSAGRQRDSESPSETLARTVAERVAKAWDIELVVTSDLHADDTVLVGRRSNALESADLVVLPAPLSPRELDRAAIRSMTEWGGASLLMCVDIGLRVVEAPGRATDGTWDDGII